MFTEHPITIRVDDTYVITHNGWPYHVIPNDPLFLEVQDYASTHPNQVIVEVPYVPSLEEVKNYKIDELVLARNNSIDNDGAEYKGFRFWADKGSKSDIHFAITTFDETGHLEPFWKAMNGIFQITNRSDLIGIASAIGNHVSSQFAKEFMLISKVQSATTVEDVQLINW